MPLSADDIRTAFDALSSELAKTRERAELVVVGDVALVLFHGADRRPRTWTPTSSSQRQQS